MTNQIHSFRMKEDAFCLYCAGNSIRQVHERLIGLYGDQAPGEATLKRWSAAHQWVERRNAIHAASQQRQDAQRVLLGADYLAELQSLRIKLLEDARSLPVRSAEGACTALNAVEKIIDRLKQWEAGRQMSAMLRPLLDLKLQELERLKGSRPLGRGIIPHDGRDNPDLIPE